MSIKIKKNEKFSTLQLQPLFYSLDKLYSMRFNRTFKLVIGDYAFLEQFSLRQYTNCRKENCSRKVWTARSFVKDSSAGWLDSVMNLLLGDMHFRIPQALSSLEQLYKTSWYINEELPEQIMKTSLEPSSSVRSLSSEFNSHMTLSDNAFEESSNITTHTTGSLFSSPDSNLGDVQEHSQFYTRSSLKQSFFTEVSLLMYFSYPTIFSFLIYSHDLWLTRLRIRFIQV